MTPFYFKQCGLCDILLSKITQDFGYFSTNPCDISYYRARLPDSIEKIQHKGKILPSLSSNKFQVVKEKFTMRQEFTS